jgi:abequosyltransferase
MRMIEEIQTKTDSRPLLTIAIPTYNRARYLKELLSVLFDQLVAEPRVELIISDNASPDETPVIIQEFQKLGLPLRNIRNQINIGADANFQQCFEQARGKYFWLFGDDDIIVPGGVARILALLDRQDYAIAYVSTYEFRNDYVTERTWDKFGRIAEPLAGGLELIRRIGAMVTFISAMIVNKDRYLSSVHPPLDVLIGTNLMQLGYLLPVVASSMSNLYIWERLVAARGGNCSGWGACQVFGINLKRVAEQYLGDRRDIAAALCNHTLQNWFPGTIMESREGTGSQLNSENMCELLESIYKTNGRYWFYVYPLITFPLAMARLWYSFVRVSNRVIRIIPMMLRYWFRSGQIIQNQNNTPQTPEMHKQVAP